MPSVKNRKFVAITITLIVCISLIVGALFSTSFREFLGWVDDDSSSEAATLKKENQNKKKSQQANQRTSEPTARLQWVECWFDIPEDREIDCGRWYFTPESSQDSLPVVVLRDRSADHQPDPVFYLSGGPGNSTYLEAENIETWFYWSQIASLSRDLVFVDQRGTGLSKPKINCPDYADRVRDVLGTDLSIEEEFKQLNSAISECLEKVSGQGNELSQFSTKQSAIDMDAIANALGYDQWNIVGGSYGTRLGLEWLALQPEKIKTAVLDSVYPPSKGSLVDWPRTFADSFSRLWNLCELHEWCTKTPDELRRDFFGAAESLNEHPQTISVSLWQGGWPIETVVNGHRFVSSVYHALYDDTLHDDIINVMAEIAEGETTALTKLAENSINSDLAPEFNPLVYFAIECAETRRVTEQEYNNASAAFPEWEPYTRYAWQYDVCRHITSHENLPQLQSLASIQQPVLLLSGGLDPVTPSSWAFDLADILPNAQHWHFPNIGHGVINSSACVHEALRQFIDNPQNPIPNPCLNP